MGGHAAGEVASGIAMAEIGSWYQRSHEDPGLPWPYDRLPSLNATANRLMCGIKVANRRIFEYATGDQRRRGMGTTVVGVGIAGEEVSIAHVGDSRAYRIDDGTIERLTRDHSLLEQF